MTIRQRYVGEVNPNKKETDIMRWRQNHDNMDVSLELRPRALILRTVEVS